jgi:hypothetical protein
MNASMHRGQWLVLLGLVLAVAMPCEGSRVGSTFVQLNRGLAERPVEDWQADFDKMHQVGISAVIVQWTADAEIAYVKDARLPQAEQYETLSRIFAAAAVHGIKLRLGLYNEPSFWGHIEANGNSLRDFFLIRVARNELLQQVLVERFGDEADWVGYYLPDEIDDLNWRNPVRRAELTRYLTLMTARLQLHDAARPVAVSAFFKGRTAPQLFANNLFEIVTGTGIAAVLVQDGSGTHASTGVHVEDYFKALVSRWGESPAALWAVVEAFEQTSEEGAPFAATSAPPARFDAQIKRASRYFGPRIVMFTFMDYVDPDRGAQHRALYQQLRTD